VSTSLYGLDSRGGAPVRKNRDPTSGPLSAVIVILLGLSVVCASPVDGQTYTNNDSIEVRGLVFIGRVEKFEYAFDESVRAELVVANRRNDPISLLVPNETCSAMLSSETWCLALSDSCTQPFPLDIRPCFGYPYPDSFVVTFSPGARVLQRATLRSEYPGSGWEFRSGSVAFYAPWTVAPYWRFSIRYERVGSSPVASYSWAAVKSLYR
jgi:hypothetical protein